jgi:hypothetical protein
MKRLRLGSNSRALPGGQPRAAAPTWFVPRRVMELSAVVETLKGASAGGKRGAWTAYPVRVREPDTSLGMTECWMMV